MRLHLLLVSLSLVACKPAAEKENPALPSTASATVAKDAPAAAPSALGPFSKIRNEGTADIDATVGKAQTVGVACSDGGPITRVMLSVTGSELLVRTKPNENTRCTVTVTVEALAEVASHGTGTLNVHGTAALARVTSEGTGAVHVDAVDVPSLDVKSQGTGALTFAGKATTATFVLAGTGALKAKELAAESVKLTLTGTGNATVMATRKADVSVEGLGNVTVHGNPAEKLQKKEGLGKITFAP